jgi:hypothetical protein
VRVPDRRIEEARADLEERGLVPKLGTLRLVLLFNTHLISDQTVPCGSYSNERVGDDRKSHWCMLGDTTLERTDREC